MDYYLGQDSVPDNVLKSAKEHTKTVREKLKAFIEQAKKEKKWIYCRYLGEWYLPEDLSKENKEGRKIWDPSEFELRNPIERFRELKSVVESASLELQKFADKLFDNTESFNNEPVIGKELAEFWNSLIEEHYSHLNDNEKL